MNGRVSVVTEGGDISGDKNDNAQEQNNNHWDE